MSSPGERQHATHAASILSSRFFFKFSRMIQRTSGSGLASHLSINDLPSPGSADDGDAPAVTQPLAQGFVCIRDP